MQEVFTAVALDGETLNKPLLSDEEQGVKSETQVVESTAEDTPDVRKLYPTFRNHGMIIGFLVQLVNVTGSSVMYYRWGDEGIFTKHTDLLDALLHFAVFVVTQVDLYLYIFMWIALTSILTHSGMAYVKRNYSAISNASKRSIFVLGVHFYVGVVVGVFLAWAAIDCLLGLPVPLLPMLGILGFGLFISYTMVWCYDLEDYLENYTEEIVQTSGRTTSTFVLGNQ
jgi:hypothetical protein